MHALRRFGYHTISVFLFVLLLLGVLSITLSLTFGKPDRLESWLTQSKVYDHAVDEIVAQSSKSASSNQGGDSGKLPLSDPAVQQAVKAAFTPVVIQNAVNTFLNANYAWLEGKTPIPEFSIDLSQEKASLAANLGAYATQRAAGLPRCGTTAASAPILTNIPDYDALTATCLPLGILPVVAGQSVQQKLATGDFLSNPVITAQNINNKQVGSAGQQTSQPSKPYYVKFASLPRAYRLATKLPWLLCLLAVLCGLAVMFMATTRRRGIHRIASLLFGAGLVILLVALTGRVALQHLDNKILRNSDLADLRQSLVDFAHRVQLSLFRINLWFAIGFIATGLAIWLLLKFVRPSAPKQPKVEPPQAEPEPPTTPKPKTSALIQL